MMPALREMLPPDLAAALQARFPKQADIYTRPDAEGYWSNIDREAQRELLAALQQQPFERVVREKLPELYGYVSGERRAAGLDLLEIRPHHVGIDLGCMWGNLLVAAARRCSAMVGVDKTREHLLFLQHRLAAEGVANVALLNADLRDDLGFDVFFDFAIVNGVLEWLPADDEVVLSDRREVRQTRFVRPRVDPRLVQLTFLERVKRSLKPGGSLYLGIENRYDYQHFLWKPDPHARLRFSAQAPRPLANLLSNLVYGRPYVNYLYSARELETLLRQAGFTEVHKHVAFPNYRHPMLILPLQRSSASKHQPVYPEKTSRNLLKKGFRQVRAGLDALVYRRLQRLDLAPAFIFIAKR